MREMGNWREYLMERLADPENAINYLDVSLCIIRRIPAGWGHGLLSNGDPERCGGTRWGFYFC